MTPTICGHEREALIWALGWHTTHAIPPNDISWPEWARGERALQATNDPAKLAELLAEASIAAGLDMSPNASLPNYDWTRFRVYPNHNGNIALDDLDQLNPNDLTLSQARAALLRILELPEGSTVDDAVKALSDVS
jgi:hypothetical protein